MTVTSHYWQFEWNEKLYSSQILADVIRRRREMKLTAEQAPITRIDYKVK